MLESIDFDLGEVLDKTLEMMAIRAHEKGLKLALRIAPEIPTALVGDPAPMRQVLMISLATPSSSQSKAR